MILDGELDEVEENDFYMKGGIDSVIKLKNPNTTLCNFIGNRHT